MNANSNGWLYCSLPVPTQGVHPRIITEGFDAAKVKALAVLEEVKITREMDRETLISVARTSLRTKVHKELADLLTEVSMLEREEHMFEVTGVGSKQLMA